MVKIQRVKKTELKKIISWNNKVNGEKIERLMHKN